MYLWNFIQNHHGLNSIQQKETLSRGGGEELDLNLKNKLQSAKFGA